MFMILGITILSAIIIYSLRYFKYGPYKPNVILITIDALRPDHLSCYGYPRETSPNIDRLAKEGTMFTQAITAGGWTGESIASILTGTYSFIHEIRRWKFLRNPSIKTLPQLLNSRNYRSSLFSNHRVMKILDVEDGFDLIDIVDFIEEDDHLLTVNLIDWIKLNKHTPFFIYIHYHGSHVPYAMPQSYKVKFLNDEWKVKREVLLSENTQEPFSGTGKIPYSIAEKNISDLSYYVAQYDGAISYTDAQIGLLIDTLKQSGLLENTLIILSADHAEMLGEHNIYFNHLTCYENNIKVPLIIRYPKLFPKGRIIQSQVSLVDIVPTVLKITKMNIPRYIQGKSLLPLVKKDKTLHPYVYTADRSWCAIRSGGWKLTRCWNRGDVYYYQLFNFVEDPDERYNLVNVEKKKFKQLKKILDGYENEEENILSMSAKFKSLTTEEKKMIRSLGYAQ